MILFTEQEYASAEYDITVRGSIRGVLHDDQGEGAEGYTINGDTVSGSVWGNSYDKIAFDGRILSLSSNHDSTLEVYSNYEKVL